jgi:hypothetical protein
LRLIIVVADLLGGGSSSSSIEPADGSGPTAALLRLEVPITFSPA